jgi:large subunit ribosomal protein L23
MINYYDMIVRPVVTEKTTEQKEKDNQVTFEVNPKANRIEIKRAIENIFSVKVEAVRTMNIQGKVKRRGRVIGKRKNWKKAIVTLMPDQRIDFFDGV